MKNMCNGQTYLIKTICGTVRTKIPPNLFLGAINQYKFDPITFLFSNVVLPLPELALEGLQLSTLEENST